MRREDETRDLNTVRSWALFTLGVCSVLLNSRYGYMRYMYNMVDRYRQEVS